MSRVINCLLPPHKSQYLLFLSRAQTVVSWSQPPPLHSPVCFKAPAACLRCWDLGFHLHYYKNNKYMKIAIFLKLVRWRCLKDILYVILPEKHLVLGPKYIAHSVLSLTHTYLILLLCHLALSLWFIKFFYIVRLCFGDCYYSLAWCTTNLLCCWVWFSKILWRF